VKTSGKGSCGGVLSAVRRDVDVSGFMDGGRESVARPQGQEAKAILMAVSGCLHHEVLTAEGTVWSGLVWSGRELRLLQDGGSGCVKLTQTRISELVAPRDGWMEKSL